MKASGGILAIVLMLSAAQARADEKSSCDAAFETAELHLRPTEGRLLDARAALRACALPTCQSWMVDDCSKRLLEVNERIPSVVFSAQDAALAALNDVRVFENDREVAQIDGRAVEMDPGRHDLVAERNGEKVTVSVVVIEGKKAQQVVFAFPSSTMRVVEPRHDGPRYTWARPLAGGLLAGAVVAAGIGVGFGIVAANKKDDANCNAANVCEAVALDSALSSARASNVSFIVAGVLGIGSAITFFTFGRARVQAAVNHVQFATAW